MTEPTDWFPVDETVNNDESYAGYQRHQQK
jgi:hypothetical protein